MECGPGFGPCVGPQTGPIQQSALCLANAEKEVPPDHSDRLGIPEVRAVIEVLELRSQRGK
jgi:hypothetical protein